MVDIPLSIGMTKELEFEVIKEYTAVHIGSGSVSVLSTPSMILFMEIASGMLAHEHMETGYTTVGTRVCIDHLDAVLEGNKVIAKSTIKEIDNKKIVFYVEVLHEERLIGKGNHVRYTVNEKRFLKKIGMD